MTHQPKRLYRSHTNRVFAGICGGLGEYFDVDPTLVRILWVLMVFAGGSGVFLYLIGIFVIPKRPIVVPETPVEAVPMPPSSGTAGKVFGTVFIAIGVMLLLDNLDILSFESWWHRSWEYLLPALLIGAGLYVILRKTKDPAPPTGSSENQSAEGDGASIPPAGSLPKSERPKRLFRSRVDRKFLGVCGGFAEYLDIDPTIVRVLYVAFILMSAGAGIILYFVLSLVVPEEPWHTSQGA